MSVVRERHEHLPRPYHILNVAPNGLRVERVQVVATACVPQP